MNKVYLTVPDETINNFYALVQAVDLINRKDGRFQIGLAFEEKSFISLAKEVKLTSLKPVFMEDVPTSIPLINLGLDPIKISYWQEQDRQLEKDILAERYPHVAPEKRDPPAFTYSAYLSIIRDAIEIFELRLDRPSDIYKYAKDPVRLYSSSLASREWEVLQRNGIKSGPFSLVELGFCGWDGKNTPEEWGRVVALPSPSTAISDPILLQECISLFNSKQLACLGIKSTDWTVASVSAFNRMKGVVWDLRPSTADSDENMNNRAFMGFHLPKHVSAMVTVEEPSPDRDVKKDLSYALGYYYQANKVPISNNRGTKLHPKPIAP